MFAFINFIRTDLQRFVYSKKYDLVKYHATQLQENKFVDKRNIFSVGFRPSRYSTTEKMQTVGPCKKQESKAPTRWGIVSAGNISHDFVTALSTLPTKEHTVEAIAARQLDRAQKFAELHKIPKAYGSYEELAEDENIDVVYIGAINTQHLTIGKLMLKRGKAVLCEKPLGLSLKQTRELIDIARENKIFLMEAIWSRCFPVYEVLRKELDSGKIGDIVQVQATAGCCNAEVERIKSKELGGGSISDLGTYPLQFASFVFEAKHPTDIVALGYLNEQGIDLSMGCVLTYETGQTAILSTHTRADCPNDAIIIGTKGIIRVPAPFWCPTKLITPDKTYQFDLPTATLPFNYMNSAGLNYEASEVRHCLMQGLFESPKVSHEESLLVAELEEILHRKLGIEYHID